MILYKVGDSMSSYTVTSPDESRLASARLATGYPFSNAKSTRRIAHMADMMRLVNIGCLLQPSMGVHMESYVGRPSV